jgi:hypothetical protein
LTLPEQFPELDRRLPQKLKLLCQAFVLENFDCQQGIFIHLCVSCLFRTTFHLGFSAIQAAVLSLSSRPTPPHPTPPVADDERAVPVSAGQQGG